MRALTHTEMDFVAGGAGALAPVLNSVVPHDRLPPAGDDGARPFFDPDAQAEFLIYP